LRSPTAPQVSVDATLDKFKITLFGSAPFLVLHFSPLLFSAGTGKSSHLTANVAKVDFLGSLGFVQKLQELLAKKTGLHVDPWSDGPGLVVGYEFNEPIKQIAAFTIQNIGFNISCILPFNSEPARFRFGLSRPDKPFLLSAGIYGGGGFVGIQSRADSLEFIEASFEYGLVTAFQFGPASGSGRITAGVYIRIGGRNAVLSGFFNASGNCDIAGLISISANFRVQIWYEPNSGRVAGAATFSVDFTIGFVDFSYSVGVAYARQGDAKHDSNDKGASAQSAALSVKAAMVPGDDPTAAELSTRREILAKCIETDNGKGDPDMSTALLRPQVWNQYWAAFEEMTDECY
jgi:hypothetical protein